MEMHGAGAVLVEVGSWESSRGYTSYDKLLVSVRVCRVFLHFLVCYGTKFPRALAGTGAGRIVGLQLVPPVSKHEGFAQHL